MNDDELTAKYHAYQPMSYPTSGFYYTETLEELKAWIYKQFGLPKSVLEGSTGHYPYPHVMMNGIPVAGIKELPSPRYGVQEGGQDLSQFQADGGE